MYLCTRKFIIMKKIVLIGIAFLLCGCVAEEKHYTHEVLNRMTPIKDQGDSETCWIYAMLAAIETEHLAWGDSVNLSPYYIEKMMEREPQAPESKRHAMAIVGIAHDDKGEKYFIMKNSWGKDTPYEGLDYLSFDDFRRSTLAVEVPRTKPFVRHLPERQRRNSITPRIFSSSAKPTHMPTRP